MLLTLKDIPRVLGALWQEQDKDQIYIYIFLIINHSITRRKKRRVFWKEVTAKKKIMAKTIFPR